MRLGIVPVPRYHVGRLLAAGNLVELLPQHPPTAGAADDGALFPSPASDAVSAGVYRVAQNDPKQPVFKMKAISYDWAGFDLRRAKVHAFA